MSQANRTLALHAPARGDRLPLGGLLMFATGSLGMGSWVTVPGLLLLYFLTDVLAVDPALAGLALLLPKIADVLLHPWVGRLSDTALARRGHRRRLMAAACALPAAFALLFAPPGGITGPAAAAWVAVVFICGNLLFALYQVPYLAAPADLGIGYAERTRLMGFRMVALTAGILVCGLVAPLITGHDHATRGGYLRMGLILGLGLLAAMALGIRGVRRLTAAVPAPAPAAHRGGLGALRTALRDRQFRLLTGSYLAMSTTSHLVLAAVPYYAAYELGRPRLTTVLVAAFVAPALVATPAWVAAARRFGKQPLLLAAQGVFALGSLALAVGRPLGLPALVGAVAVLGLAFAAMQLLPFSMVPDVIEANGAVSTAGAYTGVWTAAEATGAALGPYLYAGLLALGGFVAGTADQTVTQPGTALTAVRLGFGLLPAALMLVALLTQRGYTLDRRLRAAEASQRLAGDAS